jgi:homoserine O-acetyltransferase
MAGVFGFVFAALCGAGSQPAAAGSRLGTKIWSMRAYKGLAAIAILSAAEASLLFDPGNSFWTEAAPETYRARFETTKGSFVLEATRALAPHGADRFYNLIRAGFYDDSRFYRVISGRFVQFGIAGDPKIASVWRDRRIPADPERAHNVRGCFAFAMVTPDARTTQIYIATGDMTAQDGTGFAPFGKVVEGMDVLERLYAGYGERSGGGMRAGRQDKLFEEGNGYLDRNYPELDKLIHAAIVPK